MKTVAALYIDPRGPYPKIPGVDCWDESRDARKYAGPYPVVAHPPCGPWGRLRHLYRGTEHDCAVRVVEQVRAFGGVLEHPAGSKLWGGSRCGKSPDAPKPYLPMPPDSPDEFGGYTILIDQCEWGHVARKRTWLYLVGVPRSALEPPPFPGRKPTHRIGSTTVGRLDGSRYRPASNLKSASSEQRRRTPPLFAEYLVRLARSVQL